MRRKRKEKEVVSRLPKVPKESLDEIRRTMAKEMRKVRRSLRKRFPEVAAWGRRHGAQLMREAEQEYENECIEAMSAFCAEERRVWRNLEEHVRKKTEDRKKEKRRERL